MTQPAGWYPDPSQCWEHRWWDGAAWTDRVQTGSYAVEERYPTGIQPPPDRDAAVFEVVGSKAGRAPDRLVVTWNGMALWRAKDTAPLEVLPLWMIQHIEVWEGAVKSMAGVGDLRITVGYTGYVGRAIRVIANVNEPHWAKAMLWRQRGLATLFP